MPHYEYRVLPAPEKGKKAKGLKGPKARYAHAVEELMNEMGAEGWEYLRADTLPSEERSGLTSTVTEWRTLLVFRRIRLDQAAAFKPKELPAPEEATDTPAAAPAAAVAAGGETEDLDALLKDRAESLVPMPTDLGGPADDGPAKSEDAPDETPRRD